jgi:mRNA interferase MazF
MVLVDQVRSIDKAERLLRFIEPTSPAFLGDVRSYLGRLLGLELPDNGG